MTRAPVGNSSLPRAPRVLMVTPRYLPYIGGVERAVHEISRRLAGQGVEVTVLTTDPTQAAPRHEELDGVHIVRVMAWPRRRDYYFAPEILRVISTHECDVVHVQSYHTFVAPLAMIAARRRRLPYAVTFHGGGHSSRMRRLLRRPQWTLLRPLLARADRLIAIARFEIDLYSERLRIPRERFVLIPLGIDVSRAVQTEGDRKRDSAVIASVGRLERYKGHHRLIEALPVILEHRPDVKVWVAGVGPYQEELERLAQKLGVSDRVEIRAVPAADPDAMARELSKVSLVVLLSEHETQPVAVLEAVALGRPVLVLDTTGLRELADRGLARSIPRNSTSADIAEAVLGQLKNPFVPTRAQLPSWDECAARHADLYREMTSATPDDAGRGSPADPVARTL